MDADVNLRPSDTPIAVAALREAASDPTFDQRLILNHREAPPDQPTAGWGIYPWWRFESVRVDSASARYVYTFRNNLTGEPADWIVVPWEAGGAPQFEMVTQATLTVLMIKARTTWRDVAGAFIDRLRAGTVLAVGRIGSPLGPIRPIPADAWTSLVIADWGAGVAKVAGDEQQVIYGVHIAEEAVGAPCGPSVPKKRGRRPKEADLVRAFIREKYPNGLPLSVSAKQLSKEMRAAMSDPPSDGTIVRVHNSLR